MATTVRGTVTAADGPDKTSPLAQKAREARPQPRPDATPLPSTGDESPYDGAARFLTTDGTRGLRLILSLLPAGTDEADDARTLKAIESLGTDTIKFRAITGRMAGAYVTRNQALIAWLRGRIAAGRITSVQEDVTLIDIGCPKCGKQFPNTKTGQTALAAHLAKDHTEE